MDSFSKKQAEFYDQNPPLSPWPDILLKWGVARAFRPKEYYWKEILDGFNFKPGQVFLDVGCGQGLYTARISKTYGCRGVGLDASAKSIAYANRHFKNKKLKFIKGEATNLPFPDNYFDQVLSFDMLEHINKQKKGLEEMVRVLKKGGKLLIYTLNRKDKYTLDWCWNKLGFDIYSRAFHQKSLFIDPSWVRQELRKLNLQSQTIGYYDAFFTLALDEAIMVAVLILNKMGFGKNKITGNIFLRTTSLISKILYPITFSLDRFWFSKGYSIGLSIVGEKYSK